MINNWTFLAKLLKSIYILYSPSQIYNESFLSLDSQMLLLKWYTEISRFNIKFAILLFYNKFIAL